MDLAEFVRRYTSRAVDIIYSASMKALLRLYWSPIKTLSRNTRRAVALGPRLVFWFVFNTCFGLSSIHVLPGASFVVSLINVFTNSLLFLEDAGHIH